MTRIPLFEPANVGWHLTADPTITKRTVVDGASVNAWSISVEKRKDSKEGVVMRISGKGARGCTITVPAEAWEFLSAT